MKAMQSKDLRPRLLSWARLVLEGWRAMVGGRKVGIARTISGFARHFQPGVALERVAESISIFLKKTRLQAKEGERSEDFSVGREVIGLKTSD